MWWAYNVSGLERICVSRMGCAGMLQSPGCCGQAFFPLVEADDVDARRLFNDYFVQICEELSMSPVDSSRTLVHLGRQPCTHVSTSAACRVFAPSKAHEQDERIDVGSVVTVHVVFRLCFCSVPSI